MALPAVPPCTSLSCLQSSIIPPASPGLCLQVLLSARVFKERSSALLIAGTASGMCHHSPCQLWFLWTCILLYSLWAGWWGGQAGELHASRRETSAGDLGRIPECNVRKSHWQALTRVGRKDWPVGLSSKKPGMRGSSEEQDAFLRGKKRHRPVPRPASGLVISGSCFNFPFHARVKVPLLLSSSVSPCSFLGFLDERPLQHSMFRSGE